MGHSESLNSSDAQSSQQDYGLSDSVLEKSRATTLMLSEADTVTQYLKEVRQRALLMIELNMLHHQLKRNRENLLHKNKRAQIDQELLAVEAQINQVMGLEGQNISGQLKPFEWLLTKFPLNASASSIDQLIVGIEESLQLIMPGVSDSTKVRVKIAELSDSAIGIDVFDFVNNIDVEAKYAAQSTEEPCALEVADDDSANGAQRFSGLFLAKEIAKIVISDYEKAFHYLVNQYNQQAPQLNKVDGKKENRLREKVFEGFQQMKLITPAQRGATLSINNATLCNKCYTALVQYHSFLKDSQAGA